MKKIKQLKNRLYKINFNYKKNNLNVYGTTPEETKQKYLDIKQTDKLINTNEILLQMLELLKELKNSNFANSEKETVTTKTNFLKFYEIWFNDYKKPLLSKNSLDSIKVVYNKHILPYLKNINIEELQEKDLKVLFDRIPSEKARTKTICYNNLNNLLKYALKRDLIKINPLDKITIKKEIGEKKRAFTKQEQQRFENYLKNNYSIYNNYFLFVLYSGCRRQEALDIRQSNIDRVNLTLLIPGTKTKASKRVIPISKKLLELLGTNEIPFPFEGNAVQHNFKKIIKQLNFEKGLTLHTLRHTFATRALEKGINAKVIQKWLGHSSIKITMDIYSDIQTEFEKQEFLKLENL